jgi:DNA-damage-inducible protein J
MVNWVGVNYIVIHTLSGVTPMVANALVQARVDATIKAEAAAVLATIGLTVSDAVRLMLIRVAQEKALPFEPLIPNAATIAAMEEARAGNLETVTLAELQAMIDADD